MMYSTFPTDVGQECAALYRSTSAQELSFEGKPALRWEQPTACALPPPGAIYSAGFSAATQDVLQQHLQPLPNPSSALAPIPKAVIKPYRPPSIPGGLPDQAQQQQAFAPAMEAWYAQAGILGAPSAPPQNNRSAIHSDGPPSNDSMPSLHYTVCMLWVMAVCATVSGSYSIMLKCLV